MQNPPFLANLWPACHRWPYLISPELILIPFLRDDDNPTDVWAHMKWQLLKKIHAYSINTRGPFDSVKRALVHALEEIWKKIE